MNRVRPGSKALLSLTALLLAAGACSSSRSTQSEGWGSAGSGGTTGSAGGIASGGSTGAGGSSGIGGSLSASATTGSGGRATGATSGTGAGQSQSGASGGSGGSDRSGGAGGSTVNSGGSSPGGTGTGGVAGGSVGGNTSGAPAGGQSGSGGTSATGGSPGSGGAVATGGSSGSGGAVATGGSSGSGGAPTVTAPCDIYESGNTPCVAAHSTVRALYGSYTGELYQVRRADQTTRDISVLTAGGFADSASQDSFCAGTQCTLSIVYDQSPEGNDLTLTSGGWIGDRAYEADATGITITVSGHKVYGIHIPQSDGVTGVGYRNNSATGTAEGDEPESMYMVTNGRYYNDLCCFDYGNAQRNSENNGSGTMEAIYFGAAPFWGIGDGDGPWVMADLENGVFAGQTFDVNPNNTSLIADYVTAMLKGRPGNFAIKGGDAQSGSIKTMYDGPRPNGYDPMKKEGAIILGTGGDNSFTGVGDFFEGAMTTGYASDATDDAVQANIVAAGYGR